jgi:transposase
LTATAISALAPPPETFRKERNFAAWLGLTPRQYSTAAKQRLGAKTKMGERSLRRLPIISANSVIIKRRVHQRHGAAAFQHLTKQHLPEVIGPKIPATLNPQ